LEERDFAFPQATWPIALRHHVACGESSGRAVLLKGIAASGNGRVVFVFLGRQSLHDLAPAANICLAPRLAEYLV
jgi:hypothetical protein